MTRKIILILLLALSANGAFAFSKRKSTAPTPEEKRQVAQPPNDMVWVAKPDQAKSCAKERGIDPDKMAQELKKADIKVAEKKKVHDTAMRIQMCGADKGDMNGFLIPKKDLERAKGLGFSTFGTSE